jgi:hypothetical protein
VANHLLHAALYLLAAVGEGGSRSWVNSLFNGWRMEDVWLDRPALPDCGCRRRPKERLWLK